jgi:PAS domain-containing protein
MPTTEHLQERLGSALYRLATLRQRVSEPLDSPRSTGKLLSDLQKLTGELERALGDLQQAMAQQAELQQRALVASRRAERLFELSPVPCVVLDTDGTVVEANPSAVRMLNVSNRHLAGKAFSLFLGGERELFLARLQALRLTDDGERWPAIIRPRERSAVRATVIATLDPDGRAMLLLVSGEPEQDEVSESPLAAISSDESQ